MRVLSLVRASLATAALLSFCAAQNPGPAGPVRRSAIYAASLLVRARVQDSAVSTELECLVRNRGEAVGEADWLIPLPEGAMADGFTMTVGDQTLQGEVLDAERARGVYEQIVRRQRDPGLLEYFGRGCLRARVYPIPPRGEVLVKVRLRHVLAGVAGAYEWSLPLRAFAAGELPPERCTVDVAIASSLPLEHVYAPHADVDVRVLDAHRARATFEASGPALRAHDLRVFYSVGEREFALRALTYARPGEDGYFAVSISPKREWGEVERVPRCIQFVIDTSGSMSGRKLEQAKSALRYFLDALQGGDSFNVIPFATEAAPFFERPAPVSRLSLEAAHRRIDSITARGGTNIEDSLQRALATAVQDGDSVPALPIVVFLTDGEPTVGETDRERLLAKARELNAAHARVFVLGVGDWLDAKLLDRLAAEHGGARDYVREREDIDTKSAALFAKLSNPVLTDAVLELGDLDAYDVQPKRLPDVFLGQPLVVTGRYRNAGKHTLRLRGQMRARPCAHEQEVDFAADARAHDFVPALWAQRQVDTLLDAIHQHGRKPELLDEVQRLARQFGIVTPFTSHLIVEEGIRLSGGVVPRAGPAGPATSGPEPRFGSLGPGPGPNTPGPSGPSTPGPSGPNTPGPRGSATSAGPDEAARERLRRLGSNDQGAGAVADSRDTRTVTGSDDFYLGGKPSGSAPELVETRRAGVRTFYRAGDRWLDSRCAKGWEAKAKVVLAFSAEYFALVAKEPDLRAAFALGERVVVVAGEQVIEVRPE